MQLFSRLCFLTYDCHDLLLWSLISEIGNVSKQSNREYTKNHVEDRSYYCSRSCVGSHSQVDLSGLLEMMQTSNIYSWLFLKVMSEWFGYHVWEEKKRKDLSNSAFLRWRIRADALTYPVQESGVSNWLQSDINVSDALTNFDWRTEDVIRRFLNSFTWSIVIESSFDCVQKVSVCTTQVKTNSRTHSKTDMRQRKTRTKLSPREKLERIYWQRMKSLNPSRAKKLWLQKIILSIRKWYDSGTLTSDDSSAREYLKTKISVCKQK